MIRKTLSLCFASFLLLNNNIFSSFAQWNRPIKPTRFLKSTFDLFSILPKNAIVAEIGVAAGDGSKWIIQYANPQQLYLIDCWKQQAANVYVDGLNNQKLLDSMYIRVVAMFKDNPHVFILKEFSKNAAQQFPDEFFDWIYLDANHKFEAVFDDLTIWYSKIKKGGFFTGHDYDYSQDYIQVVPAVNKFIAEWGLHLLYLTLPHGGTSWAFQKL